jgi:hypothetical protein
VFGLPYPVQRYPKLFRQGFVRPILTGVESEPDPQDAVFPIRQSGPRLNIWLYLGHSGIGMVTIGLGVGMVTISSGPANYPQFRPGRFPARST